MIKILLLDFRNLKYGVEKFEKSLDLTQNWYTEIIEGAHHDLAISKFLLINAHVGLWKCLMHSMKTHTILMDSKFYSDTVRRYALRRTYTYRPFWPKLPNKMIKILLL